MRITHPWEFWTNLIIGALAGVVLAVAVGVLEAWRDVALIAIADVPLIACCAVMVVVSVDRDDEAC